MICLAVNSSSDRPFSAAVVAACENIPPFYLAKVLQDLSRAGLLKSARGRGGGFYLSRPPAEIILIEVVQAVEDLRRLETECVLGIDDCSDETPCALHETWKGFRDSALAALRSITVEGLVNEVQKKRGTDSS